MPKPRPTSSRASANFAGLDGARSPSFNQRYANTGDNSIIPNGLMFWYQLDGKLNEPMCNCDLRSANRLSNPPACSKAPQNNTLATNKMMITVRRVRSSELNSPEKRMRAKLPRVIESSEQRTKILS